MSELVWAFRPWPPLDKDVQCRSIASDQYSAAVPAYSLKASRVQLAVNITWQN